MKSPGPQDDIAPLYVIGKVGEVEGTVGVQSPEWDVHYFPSVFHNNGVVLVDHISDCFWSSVEKQGGQRRMVLVVISSAEPKA